MVLSIQRIPRCLISNIGICLRQYLWWCPYLKSCFRWLNSPPLPHHWLANIWSDPSVGFYLFIYFSILRATASTVCLLAYATALPPTPLPPLTWKVNSIRPKTKSNCVGKQKKKKNLVPEWLSSSTVLEFNSFMKVEFRGLNEHRDFCWITVSCQDANPPVSSPALCSRMAGHSL